MIVIEVPPYLIGSGRRNEGLLQLTVQRARPKGLADCSALLWRGLTDMLGIIIGNISATRDDGICSDEINWAHVTNAFS